MQLQIQIQRRKTNSGGETYDEVEDNKIVDDVEQSKEDYWDFVQGVENFVRHRDRKLMKKLLRKKKCSSLMIQRQQNIGFVDR